MVMPEATKSTLVVLGFGLVCIGMAIAYAIFAQQEFGVPLAETLERPLIAIVAYVLAIGIWRVMIWVRSRYAR
jgi:hypothetical protein